MAACSLVSISGVRISIWVHSGEKSSRSGQTVLKEDVSAAAIDDSTSRD